jgi:MraZ protein
MFWGEYTHHLDNKGRLIIPARFRHQLNTSAVLTRGLDNNLVIYPDDAWQAVSDQLGQMSITHPTARALRRLLFSGALVLEPDRQGRINIPPYLRDYASLKNEVLVVGMETFIEIWHPDRWREALEGVSNTLKDTNNLLKLSL